MRYFKCTLLALTLFLLTGMLTVGAAATGKAAPRILFTDDGVEVSAVETVAAGTLTVPDHAPANGGKLVGWQATVDGKTVFLPAGAAYAYAKDASLTFQAVTLHMTTAAATTARFDEEGVGLRFTTAADREEMTLLQSLCPTLQTGTVITSNKNAKAAGSFNHAGLAEASLKFIDVVATGFYKTEAERVIFAGSVNKIRFENYTLGYAAVGYVKVTYTDGTVGYVYATLEKGAPSSATPWQMARAAVKDTVPTQSESHPHAFGGAYSPYTDAQRALFTPFFEGVIALKVSEKVPGGKTLDRDYETFGQVAFTETILDENDPIWDSAVRPYIDVSKYECTLMITAPEGMTLDATTVSGVVLSLSGLPGLTINYIMGENCILLPFSHYSDNY